MISQFALVDSAGTKLSENIDHDGNEFFLNSQCLKDSPRRFFFFFKEENAFKLFLLLSPFKDFINYHYK